jgi:hypothetical protein
MQFYLEKSKGLWISRKSFEILMSRKTCLINFKDHARQHSIFDLVLKKKSIGINEARSVNSAVAIVFLGDENRTRLLDHLTKKHFGFQLKNGK